MSMERKMKRIEKIVDVTNQTENIIESDETAQDKEERELAASKRANQILAVKSNLEIKANAAAKLTALGLTVDDLKALGL